MSIVWTVLSGCVADSGAPSIDENSRVAVSAEATAVTSIGESPLPTEAASIVESPVPTPIPEATLIAQPAAGKGSVRGSLVWFANGEFVQARTASLYLASVVETVDGEPGVVAFDKENDPMTVTDEFGRFAFLDVEPGTYGLIYSIPGLGDKLISENGGDLLIVVVPDTITEMDQIAADPPF
ncbi:MAG: hypothetical protein ACE5FZ_07905 [Nitrospiria bacterium]